MDDQMDVSEKNNGHKKAFMEATISIPTTINEESSRHNSLVPQHKLTPTASMEAINEESAEANSGTSTAGCQENIRMLTFAIVTKSDEFTDSPDTFKSSDQQTHHIHIEAIVEHS